ncbi:hypothetical protein [Dyadobacter fermentans]|uniref:DUF1772 domain-containing protein n=1 Tax=Dyadobacter fermentans (strain ATCC 700827 / DSM 18053 / CIP 107007 / KCTC 52180 / NS114) TaxID=471854 RepID=C6VVT3_DYAFD|nr:hypothetical protein [Dyadobacter fermentans]ACT91389.1 hypothetical protein Dfer_0118 [Dyadobacter fermentans DSM 18053]
MTKTFPNFIHMLASIAFITIIGAAIYEHAAVVPVWSAAPPRSLSMFQGEYGLQAVNFWKPVHPVAVLLLVITLIINWRRPNRKPLLIVVGGYLLILAITAVYFVPELISITTSAYSPAVNDDLASRAQVWERLSLFRLGVLLVLALVLLDGLSAKQSENR